MGTRQLSTQERQDEFSTFQWRFKQGHENKPGGDIVILEDWDKTNIQLTPLPQLKRVPLYDPRGSQFATRGVRIHRKLTLAMTAAFQEIEEAGLHQRLCCWNGAFTPRLIRGSKTSLSNHSWGTAIDINCHGKINGLGKAPQKLGEPLNVVELVPIFERHGFFWGGNFRQSPDGMHFEAGRISDSTLPTFPDELHIDGKWAKYVVIRRKEGTSYVMDDMLLRALGRTVEPTHVPALVPLRTFLAQNDCPIERVEEVDRQYLRIFAANR